jgi:hypothetical protein
VALLEQLKVGDRRALGTKNADNTEMDAEEAVSGTFRNLAGTIVTVDTAANTHFKRLHQQAECCGKVTQDAQPRKLPPEFAQRIATRPKGAASGFR